MSSSPSPENLSPTTSPSFSPPITPLEPVPPPFLPPLPPGTTSPPAENPLPPGNATSAPPVPTLPPPLPAPVPEKAVSPPPISDSPPSPILPPPPIPSEPPSLPSPTFSPPPIPSEPTSPPSPIFSPPPFPSEPPSLPSPIFSPPPSPSEPPLSPPKLKRKPSLPSTATPPPEAPEVPDSPSPEPQSTTAIPPSPTPSKSSPTPNGSPAPDSAAQPRRPAMNFPPFPKSPPSHPIPTPETTSPSSSVGFLPAALQLRKAGGGRKLSAGFIAGSAVASLVVVFAVAVAFVICCKRRRMNRKQKKKIFGVPHYHQDSFRTKDELGRREWGPPMHQQESFQYGKVLGYEELGRATGWFSEGNVAGEGGFGKVYKGVLECGREVAVKRLEAGGSQGEREFRAEVETIARVHHKHLLSLLGYSLHSSHRLLVYPFLPNNSLHFHLHQNHSHVMDWTTRLKVAIGSAKGLTYLHEDCNPRIIHRDIKASNILLDFDFEPKVSDFGLARSFSDTNTSHISTRVVGTFGYLAPEYASSGKVTEKSDVYSFGVVLLELITGHPPICDTDTSRNQGLVEWARPLLAEAMEGRDLGELVDPRLERSYDPDEMYRMVSCAAACVRHSSWLRPRMSQVVHALEGHTSLVDFHEGNSDLFASPLGSTHEHRDELSRFRMAIEDQGYGKSSPYSGTTSEYGINPSISSGEATQTFRD